MSQRAVENVPEEIMGYNARDYGDEQWPEERRNDFLYRLEVRKVLSVDTTVWPSIFADLREPSPAHVRSLAHCGLWAEERALRKEISLRATRGPVPAFRTIRVTLAWDGAETRHSASSALANLVEAPSISANGSSWVSTWEMLVC